MKKKIALTMRIVEAPDYDETRDALSHAWTLLSDSWGVLPVPIPNGLSEPESFLHELAPDLLVLTGGDDPGTTPERDQAEQRLFAFALQRGIPIFAVCRGMQFINNHFGGKTMPVNGHVATPHGIYSLLAWRKFYGPGTTVNSYHTQGIASDGLGDGLEPFASDGDGNVEAFYHRSHPLIAVMWHPERSEAPTGDREMVLNLIDQGMFWT